MAQCSALIPARGGLHSTSGGLIWLRRLDTIGQRKLPMISGIIMQACPLRLLLAAIVIAFAISLFMRETFPNWNIAAPSRGILLAAPADFAKHAKRALPSTYGNGPTTVLDHFRVKLGFLAHPKNTRLAQGKSALKCIDECAFFCNREHGLSFD